MCNSFDRTGIWGYYVVLTAYRKGRGYAPGVSPSLRGEYGFVDPPTFLLVEPHRSAVRADGAAAPARRRPGRHQRDHVPSGGHAGTGWGGVRRTLQRRPRPGEPGRLAVEPRRGLHLRRHRARVRRVPGRGVRHRGLHGCPSHLHGQPRGRLGRAPLQRRRGRGTGGRRRRPRGPGLLRRPGRLGRPRAQPRRRVGREHHRQRDGRHRPDHQPRRLRGPR